MSEHISVFRERLNAAARRLEGFATRAAPSLVDAVLKEAAAVRKASALLEGESCDICKGTGGSKPRVCAQCKGTGEL